MERGKTMFKVFRRIAFALRFKATGNPANIFRLLSQWLEMDRAKSERESSAGSGRSPLT